MSTIAAPRPRPTLLTSPARRVTRPPRPAAIVGSAHRGRSWPAGAVAARLAALVVVLAVAVALVAAGLASTSLAGEPVAPPRTVVVQAGDTVWDLAASHRPAGMSTQEYVMVVVSHNDVRATALRPGTVLELPR